MQLSGECIGTKTYKIVGYPEDKHIASYVERSHVSIRMHIDAAAPGPNRPKIYKKNLCKFQLRHDPAS